MEYFLFVLWIFIMEFTIYKVGLAYYGLQEKLKMLETKSPEQNNLRKF